MKPVKRFSVRKHTSARKFRHQVKHTKAANLQGLHRGGWRM